MTFAQMLPRAVRGSRFLVIAVNLGAVLAGLVAFEIWRRFEPRPEQETRIEGTKFPGFYEQVDDVGFIAKPDQRVTERKIFREQPVYDVVYTVGPDRFRVVPRPAGASACVLLFGDSYTFGVGVNDAQTYAWQLAQRHGIAVHNFAIGGWGPHQMLAGLQSGRFQAATTCTPTHAVFLMIPSHIARVAGRTKWDFHGPRYRLGPDGRAMRDGNFDTDGRPEPQDVFDDGPLAWRRILGMRQVGTAEEATLTAAVIATAAEEIARRYPGVRLQVIDYSDPDRRTAAVDGRLAAGGVAVHALKSISPDYREDSERYRLKNDGHPTPLAHGEIADYIAREIVAKGRSGR